MIFGAAIGGVQAQPRGSVTAAEPPTAEIEALRDLVAAQTRAARGRDNDAERTTRSAKKRGVAAGPGDQRVSRERVNDTVTATAKATSAPEPDEPQFPSVDGCDATYDGTDEPAMEENGQLDDGELCEIGNGHRLRPDAAAAFVALSEAYLAAGGGSLLDCVTDSYRSYELQVDLKVRKPTLAAPPGTSNHGWGVAVDFACGVGSYESGLYQWLTDNGPTFGWTNPDWALPTGSKPEPWHWEFDPSVVK